MMVHQIENRLQGDRFRHGVVNMQNFLAMTSHVRRAAVVEPNVFSN
jgi:hypothetical protein